nr:unnamed protein product [Callosobruchus analis]
MSDRTWKGLYLCCNATHFEGISKYVPNGEVRTEE